MVAISPAMIRSRAGAGAAAHHDGDQRPPVAMHRRHEVEAGGAGVAGLDAVDAVDAAEQVIVVADDLAVVVEFVVEKYWKYRGKRSSSGAPRMDRSRAVVICCVVGQARGVDDRACASCRARAPCGSSCRRNCFLAWPIASAIATATSLAERVTTALIASSTEIVSPGGTPSLEGSCAAACSEIGIARPKRHCALSSCFEQQIERHHLGQRSGMAQPVLVGGIKRARRCWRRRRSPRRRGNWKLRLPLGTRSAGWPDGRNARRALMGGMR